MSEPSIISSRPTTLRVLVPAKSFQTIIEETDAKSSAIRDYFRLKKDRGSRAVPKPVLNGAVIKALIKKIENCVDMRTNVSCLVICLEEFSSTSEVVEPWCIFFNEVSHLLHICLQYLFKSDLNESSIVLSRFCNILISIADKSQQLNTKLFSKCAEILLTLVFKKNVSRDLQSLILSAISEICQHSSQSSVSVVFKKLSSHLIYLAKIVIDLSSETQMSVYTLLYKSLNSIEEAKERVPIWFSKWPCLQDTFIKGFSKNFSEGCGLFLNKLFELRSTSAINEWKERSNVKNCRSHSSGKPSQPLPLGESSSARTNSSVGKVLGKHDHNSSHKGGKGFRTENEVTVVSAPDRAAVLRNKKNYNATISEVDKSQIHRGDLNTKTDSTSNFGKGSKEVQWRNFQTPYYPDRRKSLSLRKDADTELQKTVRKSTVLYHDGTSVSQQRPEECIENRECKGMISSGGTQKNQSNFDILAQSKAKLWSEGTQSRDLPVKIQKRENDSMKTPFKEAVLSLAIEEDKSKVERWLINSPLHADNPEDSHSDPSVNCKSSDNEQYPLLVDIQSDSKERYPQRQETMINSRDPHRAAKNTGLTRSSINIEKSSYEVIGIKAEGNCQQVKCGGKESHTVVDPSTSISLRNRFPVFKENSDSDVEILMINDSERKGQKRSFRASPAVGSKKFKEDCPAATLSSTLNKSDKQLFFRLQSYKGNTKSNTLTRPKCKATNSKSSPAKILSANQKVEQEDTLHSNKKKTGKRTLFSKSREELNNPHCEEIYDCVRSPRRALANMSVNSDRPRNHWELRLKELEDRRKAEKEAQKGDFCDVYKFSDNVLNNRNKASKKVSNRTSGKKGAVVYQSHSKESLKKLSENKHTSNARTSHKLFSSAEPKKKVCFAENDEGGGSNQKKKKGGQKHTTTQKNVVTSEMKGNLAEKVCFAANDEGGASNQKKKKGGQKHTTIQKNLVTSEMKENVAENDASSHLKKTNVLNIKSREEQPKTNESCYSPPFDDDMEQKSETKKPLSFRNQEMAINQSTQQENKDNLENITVSGTNTKSDSQKNGVTSFVFSQPKALPCKNKPRDNIHTIKGASKADGSIIPCGNNRRDIDSGIDVTSASEHQSPSKGVVATLTLRAKQTKVKPSSSRRELLQTEMREYLKQAKESNEGMSANQTALSSEVLELQQLAVKLAESVGRCQVIAKTTEQKISEQATALDGCSGLLGPYEDQAFKALIPARHPTDYKEFARQVRARTQQRIMEAVESFLQKDQSFSDSNASIDEEL